MPGMTGVKFIEQANLIYPTAKKALLTAYADYEAAISAINAGVDSYITKPWDPPEELLYPMLDALLSDWQPKQRVRFTEK
jgi:thioredoxin reductase (NADPH)